MVTLLQAADWPVLQALSRNWAIVVMVATFVTIVVLALLVFCKYVRISLNILRTTHPPLARNPLDFAPMRGERVSFPAFDGLRLEGMLVPASAGAPRRGMVVFAHEFCSDMQSCGRYCQSLSAAGFDVLAFDFRGHGLSPAEPGYEPRQWPTEREVYDMRGAIAFAQQWLVADGRPRELGVFGISRGACAAILVAAEEPGIVAIAADGAYSTDTTIEHFMKRWAYIFAKVRIVYENHHPAFWRLLRWVMIRVAGREFRCRFPSVRKAIQRMAPRPMLFIHGERDSYLPVEQSRLLYALAPQPKSIWIAPGARHNQAAILHPEEYARRVTRFFERHLAAERVPSESRASTPTTAVDVVACAG